MKNKKKSVRIKEKVHKKSGGKLFHSPAVKPKFDSDIFDDNFFDVEVSDKSTTSVHGTPQASKSPKQNFAFKPSSTQGLFDVKSPERLHTDMHGANPVPNKNTEEQKSEIKNDWGKIKIPITTEQRGLGLKLGKQVPEQNRESLHETRATKKLPENVIESYGIVVDGAKVEISIVRGSMGLSYNVSFPQISIATSTLLAEIRNELIALTTISMKELSDPSSYNTIKNRFMNDARKLLKEKIPSIEKTVEDFLVGTLMQEMMGLGKIEFLIADINLEEIVIPSAKEQIRVYSKKYGWLETDLRIEREEEILNYSNIIARRVGRQISVLNPLLDAHLITGDRVNAVLYPINTKGNTITIRKFARDPLTVIDMINSKTCDLEIITLLWMAMEYEMNVLISGGTGSGKTSFLNACLPFISPMHRIISIEDTRELMLPEFLYWTPLVTRTPNSEGKGEVSMLDLLVNSLRMRPDRIILGEMRRQQEAMVLFEAMHTGHSVYATVHADSAAETISRLINPPIGVPPNLLKSVHLNVVMFRDRKKGIRRVSQVAEFEVEKMGANANVIYRWVPENDKIVRHSESSRFFEEISRHTGMSMNEINEEMKEKARILSFLIENEMRSLEELGKVMNLYYRNRVLLAQAISKKDKKIILES